MIKAFASAVIACFSVLACSSPRTVEPPPGGGAPSREASELVSGGYPRSQFAPADEEGIPTTGVDLHDYHLVVEKMVASMLKNGLETEDGKKPVIVLGEISNHTPYIIRTRMLGELIRKEILMSGLATFSTETGFEHKGGEEGDFYKHLKNLSGYVDPATAKRYGQLVEADYILFGNIYNTELRGVEATEVNLTFVFSLTELRTARTVWEDTKTIRKNIR